MLSFCYKIIILFKNKTLLVLLSYLPFCNNNFIMMNLNHQHHLLQLMTHFIMTYKSHFNIILSVFSVLEYSEQIICISFVKLCSFIIFFLFDKCVKVAGKKIL